MTAPLKEGDRVVEIIATGDTRKLGSIMYVTQATAFLYVTSNAERWYTSNRRHVTRCGSHIASIHDDEAVILRAQERLREVAKRATNLADLRHTHPEFVIADLADLIRFAGEARAAAIFMIADAERHGRDPQP
jgi:hypothetical protein